MSGAAWSGTETLGLAAPGSIAVELWLVFSATGRSVEGINQTYQQGETRAFVKATLLLIALNFGIILRLAAMLILLGAIPMVLLFVAAGQAKSGAALILRWPKAFA